MAAAAAAAAEAALRTQLSVPPLGLPVTAPASGLRGLSVPGLALLAAWGREGTGGALAGCGQELPRLKLERPEKGKEEDVEGQPAGSCLPLQARESLPLRVKDSQVTGVTEWEGRKEKEVSELANSPSSAKSKSCGGGQPSDRSYRIGREERRRKKCLNWQILLAAPRARAAPVPAPRRICWSKLSPSATLVAPL
ncbi:uncharacterized protein [Ciconia boyciana]|uniref:uncharacterized protein isoform X3 n=1 Tax=Ciconia boyciana TaxID=52775 RepID=UPI003BA1EA60